jgi:outer membrane protein assembly factor BamB
MSAIKALFGSLVLLTAVSLASAEATTDWNQWRGPQRTGEVAGADWPEDLTGLQPLWRIELGKGYPGPLVSADRVFVVETVDRKTVGVRALDRKSGDTLWTRTWAGAGKVPFFAASNGDWVRSTPVLHDGMLYVGDMEERLAALDAESGEVRWVVDFPALFDTRKPDFGFASSPLADGDYLYAQAANSLIKLKTADGSVVWRTLEAEGDMMASGAFSSPVIATLHGKRQLVVQTRHTLNGVDLDSGDTLWSQFVPSFRGMNILTPVVWGDRIFTSTHRERSFMFEILAGEGGGFEVRESWTNPASAYMSSPVVVGGHAYMHLGNRRVDCIDLESGESRWRSSSFGKYWSMTYQGDKILALDENGSLVLMRATPEAPTVLDTREISDAETWGHLAVSGNELFVRELGAIAAYRWSAAAGD